MAYIPGDLIGSFAGRKKRNMPSTKGLASQLLGISNRARYSPGMARGGGTPFGGRLPPVFGNIDTPSRGYQHIDPFSVDVFEGGPRMPDMGNPNKLGSLQGMAGDMSRNFNVGHLRDAIGAMGSPSWRNPMPPRSVNPAIMALLQELMGGQGQQMPRGPWNSVDTFEPMTPYSGRSRAFGSLFG